MALGGSVWVHIEGIRRCTVDLEVDNLKYGEYILNMCLEMASIFREYLPKSKNGRKNMISGYGTRVPKSLVRPVGVF